MPLKSREARRLAAASAIALFFVAGAESSAHAAQTSTTNYRCKFPLLGVQPVSLNLTREVPTSVNAGDLVTFAPITGSVTVNGTFSQGLALIEGLHTLVGVTEAEHPGKTSAVKARATQANGSLVNARVPLTLRAYEVPSPVPYPFTLGFDDTATSLVFDVEGAASVVLTDLTLNLRALYADGTPIEGMTTPFSDIDRVPYADIDGDPGTFNVPCKLDPPSQDPLLAQLQVGPDTGEAITAPGLPAAGAYVPGDRKSTSINVRWTPAGGSRVREYVVRYAGGPADGVRIPAPASSRVISGLTPSTEYTFSVSAVDTAGHETAAVEQTLSTTERPPNQAPTKPGTPSPTGVTTTSISLTWEPSSDDAGVAGYDVFRNDTKVATVTTNSVIVSDLSPETFYEFRVEAFDAEGLRSVSDTVSLSTAAPQPEAPVGGVNYRCKFPLIGTQPINVKITVDVPADPVPVGDEISGFAFDFKLEAGGTTATGLGLVEGLAGIEGVSESEKPGKGTGFHAQITLPDGSPVDVRVPVQLQRKEIVPPIPDPLRLIGTGKFPDLSFAPAGQARIALTELLLNFRGVYSHGGPVEGLTTPPTDVDRLPYGDIDGDPSTFNVPCKLDPADQNRELATFEIGSDSGEPITPPGPPASGAYTESDFTSKTINVKWSASQGSRLREYVIRYEGGPAAGVRVSRTATSKLITGLTPATQYTFKVSAIDFAGNETDAVEQELSTIAGLPNQAPSKPGTPTIASSSPNSLSVSWGASTDDGNVVGYDVFNGTEQVTTVTGTSATISGLSPNTVYSVRVEAIDDEGVRTTSDVAALRTSDQPNGAVLNYRCKLPLIGTQPLTLNLDLDTPNSWPVGEPTSPIRVAVVASLSGTTAQGLELVEGLRTLASVSEAEQPGRSTAARLQFRQPDGSSINARVPLALDPLPISGPIASPVLLQGSGFLPSLLFDSPGEVRASMQELTLNLKALYADGTPVEGMTTPPTDVDRVPYADIDGDPATFNVPCKLDPATQNLQLDAFQLTGGEPEPTTPDPTTPLPTTPVPTTPGPTTPGPTTPVPTTPLGTVKYAYALKGSTTLKTLTKGTLPLSGAISADLKLATGQFTADLTLNDTSGRLVALGFLPVTAKVGFVPSGKTTGSLVDGVLTTNSKVRIKVREVKLFGAIPLAGGNNCQTKNLSDINLKSTQPEFSPLVGGPIAGTYKISDLNGCGGLNGLVSPLTAGGGNTLNLNLTPKS